MYMILTISIYRRENSEDSSINVLKIRYFSKSYIAQELDLSLLCIRAAIGYENFHSADT